MPNLNGVLFKIIKIISCNPDTTKEEREDLLKAWDDYQAWCKVTSEEMAKLRDKVKGGNGGD
jgi:hypothetical protein